MGKSLTDVAKAILQESNDPTPDRDAKKSNPNMATLRPGSKNPEGVFANPGAMPAKYGYEHVADAPKAPGEGENVGAAASKGQKKDTTIKGAEKAGEKVKKQSEVMEEDAEVEGEIVSEDVELTIEEQIESYVEQLVAEGYDEDTIMEAVDHYFGEYLEEEEQLDEISGNKAGSAAGRARRIGQAMVDDGDNISGGAYLRQADRLQAGANKRFSKEKTARQMASLSSGKKAKMKMEEDYDLDEEYQVDMSEHVEALFAGEDLSEEFKEKAVTIFEAAVKQKVEEEIALLEAAYAETLEEQVEEIQEELSSNVDDYLNYVVEQWVNENEIAIEAGLRSELTEEFISGLRNLFAEHYIDIPEDKVSVVEEMGSKVVELEEKLNEEIERSVQLVKILNESKQNEILADACDGLTSTQANKLKSLAEGIEFTSVNEYAQKINILRENYFNNNFNTENVLDNNEIASDDGKGMISEELQGPMAVYVRTLGKKLPN